MIVRAARKSTRARHTGFTLMEVLLVLAILGVIMAMVLPNLMGKQKQANIDATRLSIHGIEQSLKMYALDHDGEFPTTAEGLNVLITANGADKKWKGPYLDNSSAVPTDPWGNPLQYQYPGTHNTAGTKPDIWSYGPDKQDHTDDDISNWSEKP